MRSRSIRSCERCHHRARAAVAILRTIPAGILYRRATSATEAPSSITSRQISRFRARMHLCALIQPSVDAVNVEDGRATQRDRAGDLIAEWTSLPELGGGPPWPNCRWTR